MVMQSFRCGRDPALHTERELWGLTSVSYEQRGSSVGAELSGSSVGAQWELSGSSVEQTSMGAQWAVSYTHLTLPTMAVV